MPLIMPPFGQRLLPKVVDRYVEDSPDRTFGLYAMSSGVPYKFRKITMKQMASAVNFIAWWITTTLGPSKKFETLVYIGISDLRYSIVCLAAIKCGFKAC
jgi:hypothetical protein